MFNCYFIDLLLLIFVVHSNVLDRYSFWFTYCLFCLPSILVGRSTFDIHPFWMTIMCLKLEAREYYADMVKILLFPFHASNIILWYLITHFYLDFRLFGQNTLICHL